ncbi:MAG: site-2 protease family protein [Kiritimatiellae bacterium]|nr:site-2 protease family protein [Kiritimatiellia bacterium]
MEILVTIFYIVVCVLLFALAILIHEFGHFIVALKLGLRVEAFSIGFGTALWKKKVNGVEYRISAIPLGGYVSIPDVDPEGTKALEGSKAQGAKHEARTRIPAWKEILVAVAGPAMNIVLAVVLAIGLSLVPGAKFGELPAEIGDVVEDGPAAKAGLRAGDVVKSVGGREVRTWTEMQTEVQIAGGKSVEFAVDRPEVSGLPSRVLLSVTPEQNEVTGAWYIMALSVTNEAGAVAWMPDRNPLKQLAWDAGSIFRVLKGLVTPKEAASTSAALGGPVMIAEGLYRQMRRDSWDGIGFLRFLNVNLAILNLLPIPVLDGGLIMFALFALVFRRRVPDFIVKWLSLGCMVILMGLMALLIGRDSWKSWKIHTYQPSSGGTGDSCATNELQNATSPSR